MTGVAGSKTKGGSRRLAEPSLPAPLARMFRQIVLWPIQITTPGGAPVANAWRLFNQPGGEWKEVDDEFGDNASTPAERHYREFVTFLPYVQRLLYGDGERRETDAEPSVKTYRRHDVARVSVYLDDDRPIELTVAHADLLFFQDTELAILAFEIFAADLPINVVQDLLFRFGRAYPSGWTDEDHGMNCPRRVDLLGQSGEVLCVSDYEDKARYLEQVGRKRIPSLASHWRFLLEPLIPFHDDKADGLCFRHLEGHRMPMLSYLAVDGLDQLTRADFVRLAFATGPGDRAQLPYPERFLENFERDHCYERYYDEGGRRDLSSRGMFSANTFIVVGDARRAIFTDEERGVLSQFRHQFFLIGLIAHFHKAALLMMSERMVKAVAKLNVDDIESVRRFRRETRQSMEFFLRFTHRYWVREVSEQPLAADLFRMFTRHLDTERMYGEAREELQDMVSYLDSDLLRRQSNSMLRLTVVTIIGLIGTTVTGFLGMNIFFLSEAHYLLKIGLFALVSTVFAVLTALTLIKSRALADFLDVLSAERLPFGAKLRLFRKLWRR